MPRFVILRHETPPGASRPTHWDLMLENNGALWTWALSAEPHPGKCLPAERLADHRLEYLNYEGPISRERGVVSRWDEGEYRLLGETSQGLQIELRGARISVIAVLEGNGSERQWTLSLTST